MKSNLKLSRGNYEMKRSFHHDQDIVTVDVFHQLKADKGFLPPSLPPSLSTFMILIVSLSTFWMIHVFIRG